MSQWLVHKLVNFIWNSIIASRNKQRMSSISHKYLKNFLLAGNYTNFFDFSCPSRGGCPPRPLN